MKTKHFLGMMAGAWMLASCSNQDELLQQEEVMTGQRVTVNAYVPDDTDSRLAFEDQGTNGLKVSWKETGESFSVMTESEAAPVTFTQTEGSKFAAPQGFDFAEGTQYYAFYPKLDEGTAVSAKAIPYDISEQTGKLDESMNLMYAKRSANGDFQFKHMLAVMKFTLKGIKGKLVDVVDISFYHASEPYYGFGTVDVTDGPTFTEDYSYSSVSIRTEELTRDNEGNYVIYAYLPPLAAETWIMISAYSVDETYYRVYSDEFLIRNEGIEAGKYYTAVRTMDEYEEGRISLNHTAGNVAELKAWIEAVGSYSGVNLTLTDDIDLSGEDLDGDETNDSNWPIYLPVSGTVDGGGHSITGIKMNMGENSQAAPFYIESTGVVKNLRLENVDIRGEYAGGIATENYGTISGCSVSGSVTTLGSGQSAGGIAVDNGGTVTGCYNVATVTGVDSFVGGIAGSNDGTITACYNTGTLSATQPKDDTHIGGIAGVNNSTITACYWNATGADHGIGEDINNSLPTNDGATKVDGEVTWETAMETMNGALPAGFEWKWVKNTDENTKTNIPLVLQDVVK